MKLSKSEAVEILKQFGISIVDKYFGWRNETKLQLPKGKIVFKTPESVFSKYSLRRLQAENNWVPFEDNLPSLKEEHKEDQDKIIYDNIPFDYENSDDSDDEFAYTPKVRELKELPKVTKHDSPDKYGLYHFVPKACKSNHKVALSKHSVKEYGTHDCVVCETMATVTNRSIFQQYIDLLLPDPHYVHPDYQDGPDPLHNLTSWECTKFRGVYNKPDILLHPEGRIITSKIYIPENFLLERANRLVETRKLWKNFSSALHRRIEDHEIEKRLTSVGCKIVSKYSGWAYPCRIKLPTGKIVESKPCVVYHNYCRMYHDKQQRENRIKEHDANNNYLGKKLSDFGPIGCRAGEYKHRAVTTQEVIDDYYGSGETGCVVCEAIDILASKSKSKAKGIFQQFINLLKHDDVGFCTEYNGVYADAEVEHSNGSTWGGKDCMPSRLLVMNYHQLLMNRRIWRNFS